MNHIRFLPKKVLNMKLKGKCPKGRWGSRWKPEFMEDVTRTWKEKL
jgi:hypothetical protein